MNEIDDTDVMIQGVSEGAENMLEVRDIAERRMKIEWKWENKSRSGIVKGSGLQGWELHLSL